MTSKNPSIIIIKLRQSFVASLKDNALLFECRAKRTMYSLMWALLCAILGTLTRKTAVPCYSSADSSQGVKLLSK